MSRKTFRRWRVSVVHGKTNLTQEVYGPSAEKAQAAATCLFAERDFRAAYSGQYTITPL